MSILIVGSVALDSVKTPHGEVKEILGGAAVYSSFSASFFSPVRLVGVVGKDFPPRYLTLLRKKGINLEGLEIKEGKTFRWKGFYNHNLGCAHTLDTQLNVFASFHPQIPAKSKKSKYLFLANIDPQLQLEVLEQVEKPEITVADTMNYWIKNSLKALLKVFKKVDLLLLNEEEAKQLFKATSSRSKEPDYPISKVAKRILSLGPQRVIIKKGEHGSLMFTNKSMFSAPAFPIKKIIDPTGAGDSFAGGLIGYLSKTSNPSEENLRKGIIYGSVLASFNVEAFSLNRLKNLKLKEIRERYKEIKRMVTFGVSS